MSSNTLSLQAVGAFPPLFLDYISQKSTLQPFYGEYPTLKAFEKSIKAKKISTAHRQILVNVLEEQYKNITNAPDFSILLQDNTYTVTTGHQLNIFSGPLYVIYKIITTINLAKSLRKAYPSYNFVPIYWLASEDHDFEEIASFNLFGKKYTWESVQTGAVGRINPSEIISILEQLPEKISLFENAYLQNSSLSNAVRQYMNELFGSEGLICLDADTKVLKNEFKDIMQDDLINHSANKIVTNTSQELENLGYKTQISAREINLFYLNSGIRERIVQENGIYKVLNTDLHFSSAELLDLLDSKPELFSPNVVLRPVYQERILPNLAYIGGPSEVPYWLQLGDLLTHYDLPMPILMPRNFALIISQANKKRIEKLGISPDYLFKEDTKLRRDFVEQNSENSLSLAFEIDDIAEVYERIQSKSIKIDVTLKAVVEAEKTKMINGLENLEKRLKKAEERNQETAVSQLLALKEKLFPGGGLQERQENFLNYYLNDKSFINTLLDTFDALNYQFYLIEI